MREDQVCPGQLYGVYPSFDFLDLEMMSDDPQLLKDVIAFVAEYRNEPESRLMAETAVNDDLGVDGDDGIEFLEAFSARFAVDLSAFPHDQYFGPEASATPLSFIEAITLRLTTGRWSKLSPLKLRQLAEAVERGSWVESPRKKKSHY